MDISPQLFDIVRSCGEWNPSVLRMLIFDRDAAISSVCGVANIHAILTYKVLFKLLPEFPMQRHVPDKEVPLLFRLPPLTAAEGWIFVPGVVAPNAALIVFV